MIPSLLSANRGWCHLTIYFRQPISHFGPTLGLALHWVVGERENIIWCFSAPHWGALNPTFNLPNGPVGLSCVCVEPLFPDPSALLLPVNSVSPYIVNIPPPATPLSSVGESSSLLHLLTTRKHWRQLYFDSHHWPPATRSSFVWRNHKQHI